MSGNHSFQRVNLTMDEKCCVSCNEKGIKTQPQKRTKFSTQQYLSDTTSNARIKQTDTSSLIIYTEPETHKGLFNPLWVSDRTQ